MYIANTAMVTVVYAGDKFDPAESENTLSYKLLNATVKDLTYEYDEAAEIPNIVRVYI